MLRFDSDILGLRVAAFDNAFRLLSYENYTEAESFQHDMEGLPDLLRRLRPMQVPAVLDPEAVGQTFAGSPSLPTIGNNIKINASDFLDLSKLKLNRR